MEVRYNYRLRVSPSQARLMQEVFDSCRVVWNLALGRKLDLWRYEGISYSLRDMNQELTDWRSRFEWLGAQPCRPQTMVLQALQGALNASYTRPAQVGRPRFKEKGRCNSARWGHDGFALRTGRLSLAVRGGRTLVRVVWTRPLPSPPTTVTVYRNAIGHWYASFVVRVEPEPVGHTGETTGLDLGLTTFATTEFPDADVPNPRFARAAAKALARSQRNHARKQPGSRNRAVAKRRVAATHAAVARRRSDFTHKEARGLALRFDRIGVETLSVAGLRRKGRGRRKTGINKAIADAAWGDFLRALEWQAKKCGHEVVRLPARNTTQNCSGCGTKAKVHVGIKQRIFVCSECGLVLDRDRNAARNLNPDRQGKSVRVGQGVDGSKSEGSTDRSAARAPQSLDIAGSCQYGAVHGYLP